MALSYSQGIGTTPLLGETIGANFDRAVATYPDRDALVVAPPGRAADLRRAGRGRRPRRRARSPGSACGKGDRVGIWAPNCAEWVLVAVRHREARRDPRQRQPRLPHDGARLRAAPVGLQGADLRAGVQDLGLPRDGRRGPRRPARPRARASSSATRATSCCATRPPRSSGPSSTSTSRSTSSTRAAPPARPRARRSRTTTSSTTASSSASSARYTEQDRVCIPVPFYHCFGMVMGNLGCVTHGACMVIPAPAFEPEATLAAVAEERCTSLYGVPTMFIAELEHPDFDVLRPVLAADRDHGRLAVPRAGHAQGHRPHAHGGRDHLLRHDRDLAGLDPDHRRRRARAPRRHRRARAPARRGQDRRARDRPHRRARRAGRAVHARLLGDARLLGGPRAHGARRSTPRAGCTPATSRRWTTRAT